ncbi:YbhB/YbcL family Raf kinase inhibitor-like protein [Kitasatospora azatica]|uniref:YbhB/YbcL family Raf kinase inhibitor-like protein n=1 Tax=Kitasatospora azatica TaxID=58347 RepID=UPI000690B6FF|nr:YbhB/YbcL family Raf kinase inhibitor-like protein [Kitasatospora azatica]
MPVITRARHWSRRAAVAATALATALALGGAASAGSAAPGNRLTPFTLTSPDFHDGGKLPVWTEFGGTYGGQHSHCDGKNLAPELDWHNAPAGTKSYVLLVNDMDAPIAGGWHHWVVYDIPGNVDRLKGHGKLEYTQGSTSWDANGLPVVGWGGPCPPATGQVHHYIFTLYALDSATVPVPGDSLSYEQLISTIDPDVLGSTVIIGTFRLPQKA